ncbi:TetR/AcrR family transcriptional regulator [Alkalibacter rhizosphaerae]|uniref:TetR/AcrR family transcriptional regulator n=1 Tax=Alkalibacter rhizosphaerae TaxID=2815577 RepID=A0A975AHY5_9FIRM|nr:TetR/AcrR family transcriptional regulator [Alkalibacter rhizosphaerae]QSX08513.1 TetR/AcrR family transcriptional regulator [Alkalibacter rhizosphaerae]
MKKSERQEQILKSALQLFTQLGYKGTTTAAIAKQAKISEVTLFRHFSSKQEIFMKCIEPVFMDTMEVAMDADKTSDPKATMKRLLTERIKTISQNHSLVKLVLSEAAFISDFKEESLMQIMTQKFMVIFKKIGIPADQREFVLRLVMGSILSFLYLPVIDQKIAEAYMKDLTEMIFDYISKEERHA